MNITRKGQTFKYGLIASMVIVGLGACQSSHDQESDRSTSSVVANEPLESAEQKKREAKQLEASHVLRKEKRVAEEAERIMVTGSRVTMSDMAFAQPEKVMMPAPRQLNVVNREQYQKIEPSDVFLTLEQPVSTFSIDVDTGAYSNVRRMLNDGYFPPNDAVRLEEFVNYFNYDYPTPDSQEMPFSVSTEAMKAPWNDNAHLVQIGIKGYEEQSEELPPSNLVFLVDVSGSMQSADKLGLVKKALKMLAKGSRKEDKISLVVYAGASGVVLEPTAANDRLKIEQALDSLTAGGSTNGGAGIELAYKMAQKGFIKDGINRVILATDGDFNVGTVNREQLIDMIERKRKTGISFSALGFGSGNYNEHLMEQLANKGNGNYGYIDSLLEAKRLLVDQRAGTLMTIAKDVKIQVEFNPAVVAEYRLLGYQNRMLEREDFNNDKVDAGEIGAGHTVTALYEIVLQDSDGKRMEPLRYGGGKREEAMHEKNAKLSEAAMISLRYKLPDEDKSTLYRDYLQLSDVEAAKGGDNIRFAASVAGFAQLLRGGQFLGDWGWDDARSLAQASKGDDLDGYRGELIQLVGMAQLLDEKTAVASQ
ncbi:vWA domain-containing protein [Kangiella geojedonensis]|uniref:von Willebrand factor type A n=1 Tax=Kangiella geojedonensis TaxID=914150 RepID=A0A0F6RDJ8_9GAMM|nr:VWA domain-containing protein [Kangiella geojedonensis]AKE53011.1 von Willebrand factor type A [Kangiella geojedonensis]